jgi:hypothetical protein
MKTNQTTPKPGNAPNQAPVGGHTRRLARPYFLLHEVSEVPEERYHGMKVGLPPVCCVCRRGTDGPTSGSAECVCCECYELIRNRYAYLKSL